MFSIEAVMGYESHDEYITTQTLTFKVEGFFYTDGENAAREKLHAMLEGVEFIDDRGIARGGWYRITNMAQVPAEGLPGKEA